MEFATPKPTAHEPPPAAEPPVDGPVPEGGVIAGKYRVAALIGDGSMGTVYRVQHVQTGEISALKLLHSSLTRHAEIIARFAREAIAAARIDHPNVVRAIDFGKSDDGAVYLVLEYVQGRELRSEMQAKPMRPERALPIMRGMVAGTRAAHEKGIIHRDLKPENIMLVERDGHRDFVKVLDFGIARLEAGAGNPKVSTQPLTVAGTTLGTPEYMSPEQVLGGPIDARSDLYSLGVIFFELLAGACPFSGNVATLLQQHLTAQPPELPAKVADQNPELARIIRILMAKSPANRFQTAAELAAALHQVPAPGRHMPESPVPRPSAAPTRRVEPVAPVARRRSGLGRLFMIVFICAAAVPLAIWGSRAIRNWRSMTSTSASDRAIVTGAEPSSSVAAAPSASAPKSVSPKPRRKPTDGTAAGGKHK
jgi:eukaryotic-like serine/threonine-protein kinase